MVYTKREREFRKLTPLASEGRSTATTLMAISALIRTRKNGIPMERAKLLSFSDNRQDAAFQAGHFNDFVQAALIRAGLAKALEKCKILDYTNVASEVLEALNLPEKQAT